MSSSAQKGFQIPIRYLLLPLLVAIIVFVVYLLNYLGFSRPVAISEVSAGPFQVIYKSHTGPYYKNSEIITEVEAWAKKEGLDCHLTFGEFLDNPQITEEARLRSNGGCILDRIPASLPESYQSKVIPKKNYVTATFEGSPGIGPMKVYPKVFQYAEEQRIALEEWVLEVYEVHSEQAMTTTYYFPKK